MYALKFHKHLAGRWQSFPVDQQILMIANELQRAGGWIRKRDREEAARAYERAFELVDLLVEYADNKNLTREVLRWREVLAAEYVRREYRERENEKYLFTVLTLNSHAYKTFHNIS
jgi:hypothetical protein